MFERACYVHGLRCCTTVLLLLCTSMVLTMSFGFALDAVDLVLYAFNNGESGDIFVQKSPAATIGLLAQTMKKLYNSKVDIKNIGIRHAEKMHETLLSREERLVSEDLGNYYRVPADNRDLNYNKYFTEGVENNVLEEYNSSNTIQLEEKSLRKLLEKIGFDGKN